jgi:hypothetical protein
LRAGEQAHRFAERKTVLRSGSLDRLELVEQPLESVAIDFDPAPTHQVKAVGCGEQFLNFRLGQRFAIEADAHLEVEERLRAEASRRLASDVAVTCGRGGRFERQAAGTRTMMPAASRRGASVSS